MKIKLAIILLALTAMGLTQALKAVDIALPELMTKEQLATWVAEKTAAAHATVSNPEADDNSTRFFTGKPYVPEAGGYLFAARTYSPQMSSWTSGDPMGFPDGANSYKYYPNPMSEFDCGGCFALGTFTGGAVSAAAGIAAVMTGIGEADVALPLIATQPEIGIPDTILACASIYSGVFSANFGLVTMIQAFTDQTTVIPQSFGGAIATALAKELGASQALANALGTLVSGIEQGLALVKSKPGLAILVVLLQSADAAVKQYEKEVQSDHDKLATTRSLIPATFPDGSPGWE
jgi:RHS repeat-associated protein